MKTVQKLLATILLLIFVSGHIAQPVLAIEAPPTAPDAPSVPTQSETSPTPPTAPDAPSVPTQDQVFNPSPTPVPQQSTEEKKDETPKQNKKKKSEATSSNGTVIPTLTPDATAKTGGQTASNNQNGGIVNAGAATASGVALTNGNTNISTSPATGGNGTTVSNTGNGQGSNNSASTNNNNNSLTNQNNSAQVGNDLNLSAVSGDNRASDNAGGASIATQDANVSGTIINAVNTNVDGVAVAEFNVNDVQTGDLVLDFAKNCVSGCGTAGNIKVSNTGNGANSTNTASSTSNNNSPTFQNNDATVGNNLTLAANSGTNRANDNVGGNTAITTGDANVSANVVTFANNNLAGNVVYGVVNIYGELYGDIVLPGDQVSGCSTNCGSGSTAVSNTGNGANSTNTASSTSNNNSPTFQNNDATIANNVIVDTQTGGNSTSDNIGNGSNVKSGNSNVNVNTINVANSNVDNGGNMWLVIVNEAGKWIGKLLGSPDGSNMAGSAGTEFVVGNNGEITVSNSGNGEGSTNTASQSTNNNSTTVQNNKATISNNLNLSANTGGNKANDNGGGNTTITTGDANVIANLVNFVNNNVKGNGKLVVTVVNVFGKWVGDFVTPGQKKQDKTNTLAQSAQSGRGGTAINVTPTMQPTQAITPTPTTVQNAIAAVKSGNTQAVAGVATRSNSIAIVPKQDVKVAAASSMVKGAADTQNAITVNLAWIVLFAPFFIGSLVLQKKYSLISNMTKKISMMLW